MGKFVFNRELGSKIYEKMNSFIDNEKAIIKIYEMFIKLIHELEDDAMVDTTYVPDSRFDNNNLIFLQVDEYGNELWPEDISKELLADDLIEYGSLIPIIAIKRSDMVNSYRLVDGNHRYMAIEYLKNHNKLHDRSFLMLMIDPEYSRFYGYSMIIPRFLQEAISSEYKHLFTNPLYFKVDIDIARVVVSSYEEFEIVLLYYIKAIDFIYSNRLRLKNIYRGLSTTYINKGFQKLNIHSYRYQYIDIDGKVKHYSEVKCPLGMEEHDFVKAMYDIYIMNIENLYVRTNHFYLDPCDPPPISNFKSKDMWSYMSTDLIGLASSISNEGMYMPIYYEAINNELVVQDGCHRYLAIKYLSDSNEWGDNRVLFISSKLNSDNIPITLLLHKTLYEEYKSLMVDKSYSIRETKLYGLDVCKITTSDRAILSLCHFFMDREVNYLMDLGKLKEHNIPPSDIIITRKDR